MEDKLKMESKKKELKGNGGSAKATPSGLPKRAAKYVVESSEEVADESGVDFNVPQSMIFQEVTAMTGDSPEHTRNEDGIEPSDTVLSLLGFGMIITILQRFSLAVGKLMILTEDSLPYNYTCKYPDMPEVVYRHHSTVFWTPMQVAIILSSYFWLSAGAELIVHSLEKKVRKAGIAVTAMLVSSVLCCLNPFAATRGFLILLGVRILQGFFETIFFPAAVRLFAERMSSDNRDHHLNAFYTCFPEALALCMSILPALCNFGFSTMFYIVGFAGCLWCGLFIITLIGVPTPSRATPPSEYSRNPPQTSFTNIVKSPQFWGNCTSTIAQAVFFIFMINELPSYLQLALQVDISGFGIILYFPFRVYKTAVPHTATILSAVVKRGLSPGLARKVVNMYSLVLSAMCLIAATLLGCSRSWIILLVFVSIALQSPSSFIQTHQSLEYIDYHFSYKYFAVLGVVNSCIAAVVPIMVSLIVTELRDYSEWNIVFVLIAGVQVTAGLVTLCVPFGDLFSYSPFEEGVSDEDDDSVDHQLIRTHNDSSQSQGEAMCSQ